MDDRATSRVRALQREKGVMWSVVAEARSEQRAIRPLVCGIGLDASRSMRETARD